MDFDTEAVPCDYCGAKALKLMRGEYTCTACCCVSEHRPMVDDNPFSGQQGAGGHYRCSPEGFTSIADARLARTHDRLLRNAPSRSHFEEIKQEVLNTLEQRLPALSKRTLHLQKAFLDGAGMTGDEDKHRALLAACAYMAGLETPGCGVSRDQACELLRAKVPAFCKAYAALMEFFRKARAGEVQPVAAPAGSVRMSVEDGIKCVARALVLSHTHFFPFQKVCRRLHEQALAANASAAQRIAQFSTIKVCATLGYMATKIMKLPITEVEFCKLAKISSPTLSKIESLMIELIRKKQ